MREESFLKIFMVFLAKEGNQIIFLHFDEKFCQISKKINYIVGTLLKNRSEKIKQKLTLIQ